MPKFRIVQFRDAIVRYEVEIEADTPQAALEKAKTADCDWSDCGHHALDHAEMSVEDLHGVELIRAQEVCCEQA